MRRPFLLGDNRRLSSPEIDRAVGVVAAVRELEDDRARFVADHRLDPEFCLPGGNYAASRGVDGPLEFFRRVGRHFLRHPEALNRLRLLSMNFTGFSLLHYARCAGFTEEHNQDLLRLAHPELEAAWPERIARDDHPVLWERLLAQVPRSEYFIPPPICGEIGLEISGIIVGHDTLAYQERIALLHCTGLLKFLEDRIAERGVARVLEIGGGYGALARHIKQAHPNVAYTICDLPEAMYFSAPYLALTLPELATHIAVDDATGLDRVDAMHFIPNYALPKLADGTQVDLVINTLSMSEFSEHQVRSYGRLVSRMIGGTGAFFEQNCDNSIYGMIDCKKYLPGYFLRRTQVAQPFSVLQGMVDIWSNRRLQIPYDGPDDRSRPPNAR